LARANDKIFALWHNIFQRPALQRHVSSTLFRLRQNAHTAKNRPPHRLVQIGAADDGRGIKFSL